MQQVIFIHGGTTFLRYQDFLSSLRSKKVQTNRLLQGDFWMQRLSADLGPEYQVLAPSMPNKQNAQYSEWSLWFDRISEVADDDCILVGHSMGAIFLAKYLNENTFPKRIKACVLIAAPYSDETGEDLASFKISSQAPGALDGFKAQVEKIVIFQGLDDPVIAPAELSRYKQALPDAEYHALPAPDHFVRKDFPELLQTLTTI